VADKEEDVQRPEADRLDHQQVRRLGGAPHAAAALTFGLNCRRT
jgi:hypothetical protein